MDAAVALSETAPAQAPWLPVGVHPFQLAREEPHTSQLLWPAWSKWLAGLAASHKGPLQGMTR